MKECNICNWLKDLKSGKDKALIKELDTGFAVLSKYQYYKGYTLFICRYHKIELHELKPQIRYKFLKDMATVAEAVYKAVKPVKFNYELLGNTEQHMHWHLIPRFTGDADLKRPVWVTPEAVRNSKSTYITEGEREKLKNKILEYL